MKYICVYGSVEEKIDNSFIQAGTELGKKWQIKIMV